MLKYTFYTQRETIQNKRQYNKRLHKNNCVVSSFSVLTEHVRKGIPLVLAIHKAYDLI